MKREQQDPIMAPQDTKPQEFTQSDTTRSDILDKLEEVLEEVQEAAQVQKAYWTCGNRWKADAKARAAGLPARDYCECNGNKVHENVYPNRLENPQRCTKDGKPFSGQL